MQRIRTVLQKLTELAQRNPDRTVIDVDLMLDYTRIIYADLLEMRGNVTYKPQIDSHEPTLDEMTEAMQLREKQAVSPPLPQPAAIVPQAPAAPASLPEIKVQPAATTEKPRPVVAASSIPGGAGKPDRDIRQLIDLNDKYLFLSELFNNDLHAYEMTMHDLNACTSREAAESLLGPQFRDEKNIAGTGFRKVLDKFIPDPA